MKNRINKRNSARITSFTEWITVLVVIIVVNVLANVFYKRVDLTAEKRYTLSSTANELCSKLEKKGEKLY